MRREVTVKHWYQDSGKREHRPEGTGDRCPCPELRLLTVAEAAAAQRLAVRPAVRVALPALSQQFAGRTRH